MGRGRGECRDEEREMGGDRYRKLKRERQTGRKRQRKRETDREAGPERWKHTMRAHTHIHTHAHTHTNTHTTLSGRKPQSQQSRHSTNQVFLLPLHSLNFFEKKLFL